MVCRCHGLPFIDCPNEYESDEEKELDSLRERVEALREGVRQTAMHFHISHTQSAFLTVPKFSDCPHPVCEAARKLLEHKEGE